MLKKCFSSTTRKDYSSCPLKDGDVRVNATITETHLVEDDAFVDVIRCYDDIPMIDFLGIYHPYVQLGISHSLSITSINIL